MKWYLFQLLVKLYTKAFIPECMHLVISIRMELIYFKIKVFDELDFWEAFECVFDAEKLGEQINKWDNVVDKDFRLPVCGNMTLDKSYDSKLIIYSGDEVLEESAYYGVDDDPFGPVPVRNKYGRKTNYLIDLEGEKLLFDGLVVAHLEKVEGWVIVNWV